jgi:hypothetical protein
VSLLALALPQVWVSVCLKASASVLPLERRERNKRLLQD